MLLTLYGGNDGLNTVIPYQNPAYAAARGPLAVEASSVLPLADGFGLHAGMPGFKKLWDAKELAIVHGVGFANPNYSHFESMDIWQSGDTDASVSTGWLGRWLDGTKSSPLRAIALGPTLPTSLSGERVQGAAIPIGPLVLPGDPGEQALYAALARAGTSGAPLAVEAATSDAVLLQLNQRLGPILSRSTTANPLHVSDLAGEAQTAASDSSHHPLFPILLQHPPAAPVPPRGGARPASSPSPTAGVAEPGATCWPCNSVSWRT